MKILLSKLQEAKVLVVGDVMLDQYLHGQTNRISPEAPVPVVQIKKEEIRAGGAANVAVNIAELGGLVNLIGAVGKDETAEKLKYKLLESHVHPHFMVHPIAPTITKLRVLSRHQQLLRLDFEDQSMQIEEQALLDHIKVKLHASKVLVLSDYKKGVLNHAQAIIQLAAKHQIPVLVDPKGTDFERYNGATLLTPNMAEFEAVVGECKDEATLIQKGYALIKKHHLKALLITRSEKGMTLLQLDKPVYHLPTQAKEVFDVTGAGDTVIATLASGLAVDFSLEESCFLANAAAGIVVGKLGTSTVSIVELEDALRAREEKGFGLMTLTDLKQAVQSARQRGEKIVMTNGCFDLLHAGHVSYLANARKLGHRLIVAVNSDESVKRLKGESRPINPLAQRMIVLGALESVDWVIPFNEETPRELINQILPDVLVKGGDYTIDQIAGGKEVIDAGGTVQVLNFEDGCSTTKMIQKILANS